MSSPPSSLPSPLATQESVDNVTTLVQALHVKLDKLLVTDEKKPYVPPPPVPSPQPNLDYASIVRALADSEKKKGKSQRAVLVGSTEKSSPSETAKHDEETLKEIIEITKDKELKNAYDAGQITHHRFPESKPAGRRIIKFSLPSTHLRDRLLSGIRTIGRPSSFEPSMFLRRDLMPSELDQERIARLEARERNLDADCLRWGVRDCELIEFKGPNYRPLPPNYRSKNLAESNPTARKPISVTTHSKLWRGERFICVAARVSTLIRSLTMATLESPSRLVENGLYLTHSSSHLTLGWSVSLRMTQSRLDRVK